MRLKLLALALLATLPSTLAAATPGDPAPIDASSASTARPNGGAGSVAAIDRFHAALLEVMRMGGRLSGDERYRKLEPVVDQVFDLPLMTRIAIGPRWSNLSAAQQSKLLEAFRHFTIANYASRFDRFDGERFEATPTPRAISGAELVLTQLITGDRKSFQLNYVMHRTNGAWRVVDVYLDGTISELARRRSEFGALLTRDGADALAVHLLEKAEALVTKPVDKSPS